ncbi:hypothetical protein JCM10212_002313 [Sporobolomyces blumeae]
MADSLTFTKHVLVAREYLIAFLTVLIWDFIATFPSEVRLIWRAKVTPLKILYLSNRYWTLCAQTWTAVLLLGHISTDFCSKAFWTLLVCGIGTILLCDSIVAMRVFAVWERNRRILYTWTPTLVFNAITLALILGVFYFAVVVAADVPNVYFCIQNDPSLDNIHIVPSLVLKSTMVSRSVLSLLANPPTLKAKAVAAVAPSRRGSIWLSRPSPTIPQPRRQTMPTFNCQVFDKSDRKPHDAPSLSIRGLPFDFAKSNQAPSRSSSDKSSPRSATPDTEKRAAPPLAQVSILESDAESPSSSTACDSSSDTSERSK